jgi:hypothetical protein
MADTKFIVGGNEIIVSAMPFLCLEAAWPSVEKLGQSKNRIEVIRASLGVLAAATLLSPEPQDEASLARMLRHDEYEGLMSAATELMRNSGLESASKGEEGAAAGSTETGTASSPS